MLGAGIVLALCASALLAPALATSDPNSLTITDKLHPPAPAHVLGTDPLGRDIYSRVLFAARVSLSIGILSMGISSTLGVTVGLVSGYYRGWVDSLLMRFTDMMLALPTFFLLLAVLAFFGPSVSLLILVLGLTSWPPGARMVRGEVLSLTTREFVIAARASGATDVRLMLRHLVPNIVSVVAISSTLRVALAILAEAALSFLGIGVQAPTPSWGNMVADGRDYLTIAPWVSLIPGLFVFLAVVGFNLLGDGIRDAFDPKVRAGRAAAFGVVLR
jgi:peptide/nickel transport system permease protein